MSKIGVPGAAGSVGSWSLASVLFLESALTGLVAEAELVEVVTTHNELRIVDTPARVPRVRAVRVPSPP